MTRVLVDGAVWIASGIHADEFREFSKVVRERPPRQTDGHAAFVLRSCQSDAVECAVVTVIAEKLNCDGPGRLVQGCPQSRVLGIGLVAVGEVPLMHA